MLLCFRRSSPARTRLRLLPDQPLSSRSRHTQRLPRLDPLPQASPVHLFGTSSPPCRAPLRSPATSRETSLASDSGAGSLSSSHPNRSHLFPGPTQGPYPCLRDSPSFHCNRSGGDVGIGRRFVGRPVDVAGDRSAGRQAARLHPQTALPHRLRKPAGSMFFHPLDECLVASLFIFSNPRAVDAFLLGD